MKTAVIVASVFVAFGASALVTHDERVAAERHNKYENCANTNKARYQANINVDHLRYIEQAIVLSNIKAQKEIKGYTYPKAVTELINEKFPVKHYAYLPGCPVPTG